ncbi:MAG: Ycf66 family protein [Calothrix sp. MO_167.B12]|nr:Ycf66 family protein [Calothrix sp. MO_167.B12]
MLAHVLALAVAIGSIAIYLAAFFFPEIHRKNDFIWSGVGLFYGLVLWVFARRITGGLLLGHVASVSLLFWFGWQTMSLRRQVTPQAQPTPTPSSEEVQTAVEEQVTKVSLFDKVGGLVSGVSGIFAGMRKKPATAETGVTESTTLDKAAIDAIATADESTTTPAPTEEVTTEEVTTDEVTTTEAEVTVEATAEATPAAETEVETPTPEQPPEAAEETTAIQTEAVSPTPPSGELEAAQTETESPTPAATEEVVSDTESAPPGETPTEEKPPSEQKE